MEILGIGPLELIFILLIALIVLGPNDMVKAGRTIGRFLRRLVLSPGWQTVRQASQDIRTLPNKLMREADFDLEEELRTVSTNISNLNANLKKAERDISPWTTPPKIEPPAQRPPSSPPPAQSEESAGDAQPD